MATLEAAHVKRLNMYVYCTWRINSVKKTYSQRQRNGGSEGGETHGLVDGGGVVSGAVEYKFI